VKGEDGIRKENPAKKGVRAINRDIAVFAFFLFLAFVFWYLNSLGKEAEAGIRYQVKYTHLPKDKVIPENLPSDLELFLKGPGYSILKLKISGSKAPVIIDISKVNYKRAPGGKTQNYYIVTAGLTKSLNVQIRSGCEITSIKPDTLFFTLEKPIAKSLADPENKSDNKKKR
jgi:hypothetical protein